MKFLNFLIKRNIIIFSTHFGLSILIPFFVTVLVCNFHQYYITNIIHDYFNIFWVLLFSVPRYFFPSFISTNHLIWIPMSITYRLFFIICFVLLHKKNKIIGVILDVIFIAINILFGLLVIAARNW